MWCFHLFSMLVFLQLLCSELHNWELARYVQTSKRLDELVWPSSYHPLYQYAPIHFPSPLTCVWMGGVLETTPSYRRTRAGYTLDELPVHLWAAQTNSHPHSHAYQQTIKSSQKVSMPWKHLWAVGGLRDLGLLRIHNWSWSNKTDGKPSMYINLCSNMNLFDSLGNKSNGWLNEKCSTGQNEPLK